MQEQDVILGTDDQPKPKKPVNEEMLTEVLPKDDGDVLNG